MGPAAVQQHCRVGLSRTREASEQAVCRSCRAQVHQHQGAKDLCWCLQVCGAWRTADATGMHSKCSCSHLVDLQAQLPTVEAYSTMTIARPAWAAEVTATYPVQQWKVCSGKRSSTT